MADIEGAPTGESAAANEEAEKFRELLAYELLSARRYRRQMTLVGMAAPHARTDPVRLASGLFRDSDCCFRQPRGHAAILMRDTERASASTAIKRIKRVLEDQFDLRISIACYPDDGEDAEQLTSALSRRLSRAQRGRHGAVVDSE